MKCKEKMEYDQTILFNIGGYFEISKFDIMIP